MDASFFKFMSYVAHPQSLQQALMCYDAHPQPLQPALMCYDAHPQPLQQALMCYDMPLATDLDSSAISIGEPNSRPSVKRTI